ncbi:MAG TPA: PD-(D/E)XK nuclease family protein [Acidimicrobiales bacterium]
MHPTVITTPYGRPALHALRDAIASAKRGDPLAPVTVVVPSNHVGVTARRLLAGGALQPVTPSGPGVVGVTFLTPYRLAELLGAPSLAAAGRRPVSTPVITTAIRRSLAADAGMFAAVAQHPATETALVTAYAELSDVSPAGLDALASTGRRAHDVVDVVRRARRSLAGAWYDEAQLADAAVEAVRRNDPLVANLGSVVVHLPQDLLQRQARLLAAVAAERPTTVIAGLTGYDDADAGVRQSLERLGCTPSAAGVPRLPVEATRTRVITTSDADDEVRAAVQAVVDAARAGTPLERIAVLHPTPRPYGRALHEQLAAAGIATNGTAVRPLGGSLLGRTLLDLLALADHGFRRADVMGLLARSSIRGADGRRAPTAAWERLSRQAGVVSGRDQWSRLLARLADELAERAKEVDDQGVDPHDELGTDRRREHVEILRHREQQAQDLRAAVLGLVDDITPVMDGRRPWSEHVAWVRRLAGRLLGGEHVRAWWPLDERRAAEKVEGALDRLADLDAIDHSCPLAVFRRTLALELDADLGRVGRFGDGVLVAPLSFAVGLDLDLVVILGMAEGSLPATLHDDSLLPDRERERLGGELPLRREHVGRQHRRMLAALSSADRQLLSAPRGDLRASNERVASRWLVDVARALDGGVRSGAEGLLAVDHEWLRHVPSFAHAVTHTEVPATEQHYRLRAGLAAGSDPVAAAGARTIRARRSHAFTRFDGNLAGAAVPSPTDEVVSSTRLERWASCPHAYLVRHLLGVEPADDPEQQLEMTPIDRGSLVHEVLERFVRAVLDRPSERQPAPDAPWGPDDHALMTAIATQVCDRYEQQGHTGRPVFWRRDRAQIMALMHRFLREDDTVRRDARRRLLAAELRFGHHDAPLGPVELPLPGGRVVRFRGSADRIDTADDGTLHVIDYKTGSDRAYGGLDAENPDQRGTRLQLAVYGLAARMATGQPDARVEAHYWFVSERGRFKRIGYPVDAEVIDKVRASIATIVEGIHRGIFPARPDDTGGAYVSCEYCDPDGLGVADLRRDWERKRADPAMALYAALAEPVDDCGEVAESTAVGAA